MTELLRLDDVHVSYRRGHRRIDVLRGVSFRLEPGVVAGVWADRSAGKTTLAKISAGILAPDAGAVIFCGENIDEPDRAGRLHSAIGFASRQSFGLEPATIAEGIASTLLATMSWKPAMARAHDALDRTGVIDQARDRLEDLSDEERMRVSLAQAIARKPQLLVADDPVAGMGSDRRPGILKLLRSFTEDGMSVLMTAAELKELRGADHIWALDDGVLNGGIPRASAPRPPGTVLPFPAAGNS
jgi:ABC-type multidrug transport system ATPase subunit